MDIDAPLYGPKIPSLDGLVIREVDVEPYMLMRAAHERGPGKVMDKMEEHHGNRHAVLFGLMSLAKMDIVETADGVASDDSVRCCKICLKLMDDWVENMAILASALGALASLSDNYANRIMINEQNWMSKVVKLMKMMETETNDVYIRFTDGVKKIEVTQVCAWKLLDRGSRRRRILFANPIFVLNYFCSH